MILPRVDGSYPRSEEHTSELQSRGHLVCRLLLENKLTEAGEPKIGEFGLAKVGQSDLTATGVVMGTPSYMSPEQAAGFFKQIGNPNVVPAPGAILFQL